MTGFLRSFIILVMLCFIFSCGEKVTEDKNLQVSTKKPVLSNITGKVVSFVSISSKIASLPKYDFYQVKDPFFSPIVQQNVKQTKSGAAIKNLKPTQKFEIDKYKLLGVMIDKKAKAAIFEDPEGKGWVMKEGMQIGSEGYKIKKISKDGVLVEEIVMDAAGKKKSTEIFISIKKIR